MFFDDMIISIGHFLNRILQRYGWKAIIAMLLLDLLILYLSTAIPSPR